MKYFRELIFLFLVTTTLDRVRSYPVKNSEKEDIKIVEQEYTIISNGTALEPNKTVEIVDIEVLRKNPRQNTGGAAGGGDALGSFVTGVAEALVGVGSSVFTDDFQLGTLIAESSEIIPGDTGDTVGDVLGQVSEPLNSVFKNPLQSLQQYFEDRRTTRKPVVRRTTTAKPAEPNAEVSYIYLVNGQGGPAIAGAGQEGALIQSVLTSQGIASAPGGGIPTNVQVFDSNGKIISQQQPGRPNNQVIQVTGGNNQNFIANQQEGSQGFSNRPGFSNQQQGSSRPGNSNQQQNANRPGFSNQQGAGSSNGQGFSNQQGAGGSNGQEFFNNQGNSNGQQFSGNQGNSNGQQFSGNQGNSNEQQFSGNQGNSNGQQFSGNQGGQNRPGLSNNQGGSNRPGFSNNQGGSNRPGLSNNQGGSNRPGFSNNQGSGNNPGFSNGQGNPNRFNNNGQTVESPGILNHQNNQNVGDFSNNQGNSNRPNQQSGPRPVFPGRPVPNNQIDQIFTNGQANRPTGTNRNPLEDDEADAANNKPKPVTHTKFKYKVSNPAPPLLSNTPFVPENSNSPDNFNGNSNTNENTNFQQTNFEGNQNSQQNSNGLDFSNQQTLEHGQLEPVFSQGTQNGNSRPINSGNSQSASNPIFPNTQTFVKQPEVQPEISVIIQQTAEVTTEAVTEPVPAPAAVTAESEDEDDDDEEETTETPAAISKKK